MRQAEVGDHGTALRVKEDVGGLEVAMHPTLPVEQIQPFAHLRQDAHAFVPGQGAGL